MTPVTDSKNIVFIHGLLMNPESRNIARSSIREDGNINFSKPHNPLLFIAGEKDHIIPLSLVKKEFRSF